MTALFQILLFGIVAVLLDKTNGFLIPCKRFAFPCGRPSVHPDSLRIVGGRPARRGAWPWMVLMVHSVKNNHTVCGGAIISERLILTATHCFMPGYNDKSRWTVIAGKMRLDRYEYSQRSLGVSKIILHKDYNSTTLENDIAIVVLTGDLTFSTFIQPICIPKADKGVKTGEMCLMAGWGETKGSGDQRMLNQVDVPIVADDVCSKPNWHGSEFKGKKTFCAGYQEGGRDACHGDSGGPLICKDGKRWVVQGIASWGIDCALHRKPGIYTEVSEFVPWIQEQINREKKGLCDD